MKFFFKQKRKFGTPLTNTWRGIVNSILYITKSGCQWRMLPKDFPCWSTVYYYFQKWDKEGILEKVLEVLNEKDRLKTGRSKSPSQEIIDSQIPKCKNAIL
ncbi:MAG TPA: transposase [Alphaproteobacteria bacterium]|nr:transposase [Alphaproteobacteria bacterium]